MIGSGMGMSVPQGPQLPNFLSGMQIRSNQPNQNANGPVPNLHAATQVNMPSIGGNYGGNSQPTPAPTASPLLGGPNAKIGAGQGRVQPRAIRTVDQPPMLPPNPMTDVQRAYGISNPNAATMEQMMLSRMPEAQQVPVPMGDSTGQELPWQTYERLTGQRWMGGNSADVLKLLNDFGINADPGSAEANIALQRALMGR